MQLESPSNGSERNVTLTFHDIRYEVKQKVDDVPCCGKIAAKEILRGLRCLHMF